MNGIAFEEAVKATNPLIEHDYRMFAAAARDDEVLPVTSSSALTRMRPVSNALLPLNMSRTTSAMLERHASNASVGLDPATAGNLVLQGGFPNLIAQFSSMKAQWNRCENKIYKLWNGYASEDYVVGTMVWVNLNNVRKYRGHHVFGMITDLREDSFDVALLDSTHQKNGEKYTNVPWEAIEEVGDTFANLITAVTHLECVTEAITSVRSLINTAMQVVGAQLRQKLSEFSTNGIVKLQVSVGLSWRGAALLPHALRGEASLGIVLWPLESAGSVVYETCAGKDTNRYSIDIAVGLAVGFDRSCLSGYGLTFAGAIQLPHNQEVAASFGLDCDTTRMSCLTEAGFPAISEISLSYGVAMRGNVASLWNPIANAAAFTAVACRGGEFLSRGPRDC